MTKLFLLPVLLLACNGAPSDDTDTGETDTDTDTDSDTDTDADADTDTDSDTDTDTGEVVLPDGPGVGGTLVDAAGNPLGDSQVLACTHVYCLVTRSEADGWFWFTVDPDSSFAIKTHENLSSVPRLAAGIAPATVPGSAAVSIGELCQPELPPGEPWVADEDVAQTYITGGGLELTITRGDVTLALLDDFGEVASALLPEVFRPVYPDLGAETIEAVYAVHPFAALSVSPIAVSAPSSLPAGTVVHFRSIDALGGALSAPALGRADGSRVRTDVGEGLYELSQVIVSVP